MRGFVQLTTIDQVPRYVAVDQISTFVARDRFRPTYQSQMTLKTGETFTVEEGTVRIAELIVESRNA